ncbi:AAA family ATPase [Stutzerimonas marianensis]|uniref:AAA family ATPase n=1 Tax=Stutzerimonas marianensis TaxID=2929513 RepID=UPI003C2FF1A0
MLSEISVTGYKALNNQTPLSLRNLNILAGANASGKSSLLQTLLLLRQSIDSNGEINYLRLSGSLYEAGTAQDIMHPACERTIKIALKENEQNNSYIFHLDRNNETPASARKINLVSQEKNTPKSLKKNGLGFSYINAERIGPRVTYSLPPEEINESGLVGKYGEYTTAALARAASDVFSIDKWNDSAALILAEACRILDKKDIHDELIKTEGRLDLVCNLMLSWIIPGAKFEARESHNTDSSTLSFIRDPEASRTNTRPTHIGFGLTYTLPIITAALSLKQGGILIVENPEAHLHPFSQSRIGVFLALVASLGRQVFVETHSDHVINGIRLAVKYSLLDSNEVILNSFEKSEDMLNTTITQIKISADGRPEKWPNGFFDQLENDLMML